MLLQHYCAYVRCSQAAASAIHLQLSTQLYTEPTETSYATTRTLQIAWSTVWGLAVVGLLTRVNNSTGTPTIYEAYSYSSSFSPGDRYGDSGFKHRYRVSTGHSMWVWLGMLLSYLWCQQVDLTIYHMVLYSNSQIVKCKCQGVITLQWLRSSTRQESSQHQHSS
jgi:hypothetical protein